MASENPDRIAFPTEDELRVTAMKRFEEIRAQQETDRIAAQPQAEEIFGDGSLGRIDEIRPPEIDNVLALREQQVQSGAAGIDEAIAQRQQTISSGGADPAYQQVEEAAQRAQDLQTQTSLRQLRGQMGAQGVRGGANMQRQLDVVGQANLAESNLQGQLAASKLQRVDAASAARDGLQLSRVEQQKNTLDSNEASIYAARTDETTRADINMQRSLQERLGRVELTEARAQAGSLERTAASQEVASQAQLMAQIQQQNIANEIAYKEANKAPAQTVVKGGKVMCTEMHRQGLLSQEILDADRLYANRIPIETKIGYWAWGEPLAARCQESKLLTKMMLPFVTAWATEMAFRVGRAEKGTVLGKVMSVVGEPVCNLLGRSLLYFNLVDLKRLAAQVANTM